jgi:hypothetical protein
MADDVAFDAPAYVDAAAALLAMPLDGERRANVVTAIERLAAFAADIAAVDLGNDVEIAGRFTP